MRAGWVLPAEKLELWRRPSVEVPAVYRKAFTARVLPVTGERLLGTEVREGPWVFS